MFGYGKCPKCTGTVEQCAVTQIPAKNPSTGALFNGVALCCPRCATVLGVSIDPTAVAAEAAERVLARMQDGHR
jgi:hypothetical protein